MYARRTLTLLRLWHGLPVLPVEPKLRYVVSHHLADRAQHPNMPS